jgi:pyridoxine 5-phosphate synthase
MLKLGVNVDHVCTVREARQVKYPDPVEIALMCEKAGATGITAHLREDRRHIQDNDIEKLAKSVQALNMEMAATEEMVAIAKRIKPKNCCLVPEKREELTTEGGLDVIGNYENIKQAVQSLKESGIVVSQFIEPNREQIKATAELGADFIELHTGTFANLFDVDPTKAEEELKRLIDGAEYANSLNLGVNAGHGIDNINISRILSIPYLTELNIGHSIIGRAIYVGIEAAVTELLEIMRKYKSIN